MSNKTIFKRIALVAVAALGAGLLTVTPASAANNLAVGTATQPAPATNILNIATAPSITGAAIVTSTPEDGVADATDNKSLGLLANSTTLTTSSLTSTATMRADGEIVFYTKTENNKAATFVIDGGAKFVTVAAEGSPFNNVNAARSQFVSGAATASTQIAFSVKPDTGTTSFTVSMYVSASLATIDQTKVNSVAAGTTSKGDLSQRYVVTVATTSASGVYSDADSYVAGSDSTTAANGGTTNTDAANSLKISSQTLPYAYIDVNLRDAYDVSLSGLGALVITATNGAGLAWKGNGTAASAASDFNLTQVDNSDAAGKITVTKPAARANKSFTTTVSISWNGVVVRTKTVTFLGEVAKITATIDAVSELGTTSSEMGSISYQDDAGNVLTTGISSGTSAVSTTLNSVVTAAAVSDWVDSTDPFSYYDVTCSGTASTGVGAGSADVVFQHVNSASGTVVKSNPVKIICSGNATSFAASFDKAVYAPGEIATLTITGKDAKGNLANANSAISSGSGTSKMSITTPANLTIVSAISDTAVYLSSGDGIKTYKFIVGTTEGSFSAIVAIPVISTNNVSAGGAGFANQTVAYKVAAPATGAVTNAEVLAAIVKLIASINKQIRALQKSLRL